MQAGLLQGRMLGNTAAAARGGGMGCLYHGYLAFLAKSLPYDVAELFTYSQLSGAGGPLLALPDGCRDMLLGEGQCARYGDHISICTSSLLLMPNNLHLISCLQ